MTFDRTYEIDGSRYRIVIVGDVIAAPYQGWSDCGYGSPPNRGWFLERLTGGHPVPACGLRSTDMECLIVAIHRAYADSKKGGK